MGTSGIALVPGLPWWATIIATGVILRTCILPVAIYQRRAMGRQLKLRSVVEALYTSTAHNISSVGAAKGWSDARCQKEIKSEVRSQISELYSRHDCQPLFRFLLPWAQIPLFIVVSFTIRRMCGLPLPFYDKLPAIPPFPGLDTGGVLWLPNLLLPETTYILPGLITMAHLINIQLHIPPASSASIPKATQTTFQKVWPYGMRMFVVVAGYFATQIPSGVAMYWLSSAAFAVAQNLAFRSEWVQRVLRIETEPIKGPPNPPVPAPVPLANASKTTPDDNMGHTTPNSSTAGATHS
ncbi:60Kd inner membrane protein-domain-containing protein [Dimargaris cristalligena]|uniref:60Kd inner membrane protein-domain-containing protein n=1 Tax=Dimargaris cristalligena TaxID=215637 RepID=A0A4P9ZTR0_9FUNG|nr:60Kd inner membrane protein-domain-containing protein [Dimargaris cristalligena]|eukprot:RKP36976.1 60Kd inner membrane protein-domain-containing protein [Dimargaris cristalligena]